MRIKNNKIEKIIMSIMFLNAILICIPMILGEVNIIKSISKETVYTGEIANISIKIINNGSSDISGILYDLPPEFVEVIDGQKEAGDFEVSNYVQKFQLKLSPKEEFLTSYKINFSRVPEGLLNKEIKIGKSVFIDNKGNEYFSNDVNLFIKTDKKLLCNYNFKCENGENSNNCIQDCLSGSEDNYCDELIDGRCDSDCGTFKDRDCLIKKIKDNKFYFIIGAIIIIFIIGAAIWRKKKAKKGNE